MTENGQRLGVRCAWYVAGRWAAERLRMAARTKAHGCPKGGLFRCFHGL